MYTSVIYGSALSASETPGSVTVSYDTHSHIHLRILVRKFGNNFSILTGPSEVNAPVLDMNTGFSEDLCMACARCVMLSALSATDVEHWLELVEELPVPDLNADDKGLTDIEECCAMMSSRLGLQELDLCEDALIKLCTDIPNSPLEGVYVPQFIGGSILRRSVDASLALLAITDVNSPEFEEARRVELDKEEMMRTLAKQMYVGDV